MYSKYKIFIRKVFSRISQNILNKYFCIDAYEQLLQKSILQRAEG